MKLLRNFIFSQQILGWLIILLFCCVTFQCEKSTEKKIDEQLVADIPEEFQPQVITALESAGKNMLQLQEAITQCPPEQVKALGFLLANMPERDLQSLSSKFILDNLNYAFKAVQEANWGQQIPEKLFLNNILPYVNLHERRDNWREDFFTQFSPLVKECETPGAAAVKLNYEIWDIVNVHYSTKRPKADQSPYESIEASMASCTGLSILLVDACRAVGVPARFIGVPLWSDHSGNHSWVEIWDQGWHFIGAGEPGPLDKSWFVERAEKANNTSWKYRIYAASYQKTDLKYPCMWDKSATYLYAENVTDRYSKVQDETSLVNFGILVYDKSQASQRISVDIEVQKGDSLVGKGRTRNESHDLNDILRFKLEPNTDYQIEFSLNNKVIKQQVKTTAEENQIQKFYGSELLEK